MPPPRRRGEGAAALTAAPGAVLESPLARFERLFHRLDDIGRHRRIDITCEFDEARIDIELTRAFTDALDIPVIASGGVGTLEHLADGISLGGADAVLAASIFHYGEFTVQQAKALMARRGIEVRL